MIEAAAKEMFSKQCWKKGKEKLQVNAKNITAMDISGWGVVLQISQNSTYKLIFVAWF